MRNALVLVIVVVLGLLVPLSAPAEDTCRIRRAEAVVCPAFQEIEGSTVLSVSGDGRTVVGSEPSHEPGYGLPVRWVEGERRPIEGLPEGMLGSASAVSRDGGVIAGFGVFPDQGFAFRIFRWEEGETLLFDGGPGAPRIPTAMNGDGSSIATRQDYEGSFLDPETGVFEDWEIPGEPILARPEEMSDDGEVVAGWVLAGAVTAPVFREGGVSTKLPVESDRLPDPGVALGVSPDGSLVVGGTWAYRYYWPTPPDDCGPADPCGALWRDGVLERRDYRVTAATWEGAFWFEERLEGASLVRDATGEIRPIAAILAELGVEAPDFLSRVDDTSYDGHVVVGRIDAIEPDQFRAVISPTLGIDIQPWSRSNRIDLWRSRPVVVRVYGSEQADAAEVEPDTLRFGPERVGPEEMGEPRDFNRDGHLDRDFVFDPGEAGLAFGDREACLAGVAARLPFRLCSQVRTTGSGWPWGWLFGRR